MKHILRFFLLAVCCLSGTVRVQAEENAGSTVVLGLEELLKAEVVQGASKYAQSSGEAPASTVLLTQRDIRAHGWRTLKEALSSVRGFYFTDDRYYSYVGVRGFAPLGDYNTNVLVTIDGHRLNENIFDSTGYGMDFVLDMEQVDHLEVILGPGSSLYGNNAVIATVNVYTRKPEGAYGARIVGEAGSLSTGRAFLGLQNGNAPLRWAASGSAYDSHGNKSLYFPGYDDREHHQGVAENLDGERQRRAYGTVSWGRWTLQGAYNHRWRSIPTGAFGTDFNVSGSYIMDRRGYLDLSYTGDATQETYLLGRAYVDNYIYAGDYMNEGTTNRDYTEGDWLGGDLQVVTRRLPRQTLIAGLEGHNNIHQNQTNYDVDGVIYLMQQHSAYQWAVFAQDELTLAHNLHGYLGVRYDDPHYVKGKGMPRAALVYEPDALTTLKAMYGKSYRAPNQYEMFYVDNLVYEAPGKLSSETIDTYELFARRVLSQRFSGEASVFAYRAKALLVFNQESLETGAGRTENLNDARTNGGEASLQYRHSNGLMAKASYSYLDTYSSFLRTRLVNSPRHLGKADGIVPLWRERLLGGVEWQGMSSRLDALGGQVGGYGVLSANLSLRDWPVQGLGVDVGVRNLCDRKFLDPVSDMDPLWSIAQNGRIFRFALSQTF